MKNLHKTCMFIYPLTFTTYNKLCHGQFPGCCKPPLSIWSRTEHRHISIGLASLHTQRFVCGILSFGMLLVFLLFPGHMTCSCASRFTMCPILMCTINIIRTTGLAHLLCRNCWGVVLAFVRRRQHNMLYAIWFGLFVYLFICLFIASYNVAMLVCSW